LNSKAEQIFSSFGKLAPLPHLRGTNFRAKAYMSSDEVRVRLEDSGLTFPKKAHRISCIMCKGGVGKTTTAYFLALRLASYGARVLVIDSDPQGNLTEVFQPKFYGFSLTENTPVLVDVLTGTCSLRSAILPLTRNCHLLPSTPINSLLETKLIESKRDFPFRLHWLLRNVDAEYDFIITDCAPSLNLVNALVIYASNLVILPIQLDGFSANGLKLTFSEIQDLNRSYNFRTEMRILINKFNAREKLSFLFLGHVASEYRSLMMDSTIRRSSEIKTSLTLKKDFFSMKRSKLKEDFDKLAMEVLLRAGNTEMFNA
jgi:chromosome partitioning protein